MTDTPSTASSGDDLMALAMGKLTRVLGAERGPRVFEATLATAKLTTLKTPDDLHRFAEHLAERGGIESAVAGLLSVAAVMRGADAGARSA